MAKAVGIDLVHLGPVVVYNTLIGFITPPVGIGLFVVSDIAEVPVVKVIKATLLLLGSSPRCSADHYLCTGDGHVAAQSSLWILAAKSQGWP